MPPPPPPPPPPQNPYIMEANGHYQNQRRSEAAPALIVFLNVVNTITQLLLGGVMFSAFSIANIFDFANSFSQHVYLNVLGYVLLMSQAILSFNAHAGWAYSLKYPEKRMIHGVMQISGSIMAIAGSSIALIDVEVHFNSAHAITGIVALIFTILSLIGGVLNFIFRANMTVLFKTMHACVGALTVTIAFTSLAIAFNTWYKEIFLTVNGDVAITFTVLALAGILTSAFSRTIYGVIYGVSKY